MLYIAAAIALVAGLIAPAEAHQAVDLRILDLIPDVPGDEIPDKAAKIRKGRELFGTPFGKKGNNRTCLDCHEPTRNFTIDPEFIATLPPSDPLFVNEQIPRLAGLENSQLLRQFGLICENLDGFDQPCVFRGVPHTFGLRRSIQPASPTFPLVNATGWSGDGSPPCNPALQKRCPGNGAFVNFAMGAIVQHETGDPARVPGEDFTVPSRQKLNHMAAFQLSLGRQSDVSIDGDDGTPALVFRDPDAEAGRRLFVNGVPGRAGNNRSCNGCHNDAGALTQAGENRQFATGVARLPTAPACRGNAPGDGGFGQTPVFNAPICVPAISAAFRGDQTFNTPSIIEAADTGPWFHNNAIDGQIEDAIRFYTSDVFNASPVGGGNAFVLNQTQVNQIGALLRALNARENVRNAIVVATRALNEPKKLSDPSLREARSETLDAIRVIREAPVPLYGNTNIVERVSTAGNLLLRAIGENGAARRSSISSAIAALRQAHPQFTT